MALEDIQKAYLMASSSESSNALESISESLDVINSSEFDNSGKFLNTRINLAGMNNDESSVNDVIKGINAYTNNVNDIIRKLDSFISASESFDSNVNAKVQKFISIMKEPCNSIINQLDKLKADVKKTAEAKNENMISDVESIPSGVYDSVSNSNYIFDGLDK